MTWRSLLQHESMNHDPWLRKVLHHHQELAGQEVEAFHICAGKLVHGYLPFISSVKTSCWGVSAHDYLLHCPADTNGPRSCTWTRPRRSLGLPLTFRHLSSLWHTAYLSSNDDVWSLDTWGCQICECMCLFLSHVIKQVTILILPRYPLMGAPFRRCQWSCTRFTATVLNQFRDRLLNNIVRSSTGTVVTVWPPIIPANKSKINQHISIVEEMVQLVN